MVGDIDSVAHPMPGLQVSKKYYIIPKLLTWPDIVVAHKCHVDKSVSKHETCLTFVSYTGCYHFDSKDWVKAITNLAR